MQASATCSVGSSREIGDEAIHLRGFSTDSWVEVKGNDWLIEGNRGVDSPRDGFQTHESLDGWGTGNRFRTNVVECDNEAPGAQGGLANVACRSE